MTELSRTVRPQVLSASIRQMSYWVDLGRALAESGRRDAEALAAFVRAEQAAPVPFALNPLAEDAVVAMAQRAKRRAVPMSCGCWPAGWASAWRHNQR